MTEEASIKEYLALLSSKAPVPGGGGASALAGALGNALGQMVANLTVGKKKYAEVEAEMQELLLKMKAVQAEFLRLADQDAEVFAPLARCYGLPAGTQEEADRKAEAMEGCLLEASRVPLAIMEKAVEMLGMLEILEKKGSRMAISDVGVGAQLVRAALLGAGMNVYINTRTMKNRTAAAGLNDRAAELSRAGVQQADAIYQSVAARLRV